MRLQCPNCDAEYEVDTSAIPYEGRDVQCSNCGHGWFQAHPDFEADYEVESSLYDPPPPLPQGGEVAGGLPKRELPPEAMQILREEVALEEAKRAAEAARKEPAAAAAVGAEPAPAPSDGGFEAELDALVSADAGQGTAQQGISAQRDDPTDPMGDIEAALDAGQGDADQQTQSAQDFTAPMPRVAPRRVARLKGMGDDSAAQAAPYPAPAPQPAQQPEQQPAQLWAEPDLAADDPFAEPDLRGELKPERPRKSGGRAGFFTAVFAALAGVAAYVLGPELGAAVPALAGPMDGYITAINGLRDQVQVIVPQVLGMAKGAMTGVMEWVAAQGWF